MVARPPAIYLTSSAIPFQLLRPLAPQFIAGVRNPSLIAGLAVPLILGLAAWGLDALLRNDKLQLALSRGGVQSVALRVSWLLVLPALWAIQPVYQFNQQWLAITSPDATTSDATRYLGTTTAQWVQSPYGEGFWLPELLASGAKIAEVTRPWNWLGRENPPPSREVTREPARAALGTIQGRLDELLLVAHPEIHYAAIAHADGLTPCTAQALGGHIDLLCDTTQPGVLVVREHAEDGWHVTMDGASVQLTAGPWLELPGAAGSHHYSFRYRPWDVPVGALLSLIGLVVTWWYATNGARGKPMVITTVRAPTDGSATAVVQHSGSL